MSERPKPSPPVPSSLPEKQLEETCDYGEAKVNTGPPTDSEKPTQTPPGPTAPAFLVGRTFGDFELLVFYLR